MAQPRAIGWLLERIDGLVNEKGSFLQSAWKLIERETVRKLKHTPDGEYPESQTNFVGESLVVILG